MRLFSLLIGFVFMTTTLSARGETPEPECVVLLHGIGLRGYVMKRLESALRQDGYRVVNLSYPSRKMSFEELVRDFLPARLRRHDTGRAPRLHFVTHSLGSLLVRSFLQQARPANLGRVVMIGPPNHGSTAANQAKEHTLLRRFLGENLARLGTGDQAIVNQLGPADFEVGVIAGRRMKGTAKRMAIRRRRGRCRTPACKLRSICPLFWRHGKTEPAASS